MMKTYEKARVFLYRNARPVDLARWQYHFEQGSRDDVVNALLYYQNEDGGFGHALEPDTWNPNSSPIQTSAAIEILHEIDFTEKAHPIIQKTLKYLESGRDFDGKFWYNTVKSNNDFPHAPWWHTESDSACHNDYNPTACLAGFIVRFADKNSDLYQLGCHIVKDAYAAFMFGGESSDMHTIGCYTSLLRYLESAEVDDIVDLSALKGKLSEEINKCITKDMALWETSYICKPSRFFNTKDSVFYEDNREIAEYECTFIMKTQLPDGSWNVPWGWNGYPEEWVISKNWWKDHSILENMLYLKGFGMI